MPLFKKLKRNQLKAYVDLISALLYITELEGDYQDVPNDDPEYVKPPSIEKAVAFAAEANSKDYQSRRIPDLQTRLFTMISLVYPAFRYKDAYSSYIEARTPKIGRSIKVTMTDAIEITAGHRAIKGMRGPPTSAWYSVVSSTNRLGRTLRVDSSNDRDIPLTVEVSTRPSRAQYISSSFKCHRRKFHLVLFRIKEENLYSWKGSILEYFMLRVKEAESGAAPKVLLERETTLDASKKIDEKELWIYLKKLPSSFKDWFFNAVLRSMLAGSTSSGSRTSWFPLRKAGGMKMKKSIRIGHLEKYLGTATWDSKRKMKMSFSNAWNGKILTGTTNRTGSVFTGEWIAKRNRGSNQGKPVDKNMRIGKNRVLGSSLRSLENLFACDNCGNSYF